MNYFAQQQWLAKFCSLDAKDKVDLAYRIAVSIHNTFLRSTEQIAEVKTYANRTFPQGTLLRQ